MQNIQENVTGCGGRKVRHHQPLPDIDLYSLPESMACVTTQAARALGYKAGTLKLWRRLGKGPKVTVIGGRPRYMVRHLREYAGIA